MASNSRHLPDYLALLRAIIHLINLNSLSHLERERLQLSSLWGMSEKFSLRLVLSCYLEPLTKELFFSFDQRLSLIAPPCKVR